MLARRINGGFPVLRLREEMGRLFDELLDTDPAAALMNVGRRVFPRLNFWEDDTSLFVEAEVPGLKLDHLDIYVDGHELTIKGNRGGIEDRNVTFHRRERGVGPFARIVHLPVEVDSENVEASLQNGVLTVTLPKAQSVLPRKITVKG